MYMYVYTGVDLQNCFRFASHINCKLERDYNGMIEIGDKLITCRFNFSVLL